jgi:putative transposase
MTAMLRGEGVCVNRKRVQRLMRLMGIAALGPKPRTSKRAPGHRIYPYLLRLSNTMDVSFCLASLEEALARFGRP